MSTTPNECLRIEHDISRGYGKVDYARAWQELIEKFGLDQANVAVGATVIWVTDPGIDHLVLLCDILLPYDDAAPPLADRPTYPATYLAPRDGLDLRRLM